VAGFCERGNETWGSTKHGVFLEKVRACELLRKDSDPQS
jgi:hypothetical protein